MSKWIAPALVASALVVVAACSANTSPADAPVSAPTASATYSGYVATTPVEAPAATYPLTAFGSGTYLIGSEVTPGRYVTEGAPSCYWEVQRENADQYGSKIVENGNANGHTNITIPANAYAIEVMSVDFTGTGGCTFTKR